MLPDFSTIPHHPALEEVVDVLCNRTEEHDRGFFRAEAAYFLGTMASMMRATVVTKDRGEIPVNVYALALATSGFGKGHSVGIMEDEIMIGFKDRFVHDTFPTISESNLWVIANTRAAQKGTDQNDEFKKTEGEFNNYGPYLTSFDSGTTPAVKDMRQKLLMGGIGSINLQMDEIGSNLVGQTEILNSFLELYDQGRIKRKLIKNTAENKRGEEFDGKTPANALLFGTPSKLFDGSITEKEFYAFLEAGFARRCIFGYGHKRKGQRTPAAERYQSRIDPKHNAAVLKWRNAFYKLADPANFDWKMEVPDDVGVCLLEYKDVCEELADAMPEHDEIRRAEMTHRYSKAIKLAGTYAFIDSSTNIEMDHLFAAIKLIEESGISFQKILSREPAYAKLAKYIAQADAELTHADLQEALPFYKSSQTARNEMMSLAVQWGYKRHVIIKKTFVDNIELFTGETLKETDLKNIIISYSNHWAYNYLPETAPFDKLHLLTQSPDMHWANHHFKNEHRAEDNVIAGFNMIVIDVDGGCTLQMAHELLKEYKFLTYTTKRHSAGENRFRLMLPINYRLQLNQDEYKEFMNNIMNWLPFETDESANQRAKKWESFEGGAHTYNLEGDLLDVLDFIPKTSRNESYIKQNKELGSLDNLERWFAGRIASGNRNNQMIKYALTLVDAGWDLPAVRTQVHAFNEKMSDSMAAQEIDATIMVTVAKRYHMAA